MNVLRMFKLITIIQNKHTSYKELVEFLFNETPPQNHNFLSQKILECVKKISHSQIIKKEIQPTYSVIITTYNREYYVIDTLNAIISQKNIEKKDFELVIINDGSTDGTQQKLSEFLLRNDIPQSVAVELKRNCGPSVARNVGIMCSKGVFMTFTDDDCVVPDNWISDFKNAFRLYPDISGVGGWIKLEEKSATLYDKIIIDVRRPYSQRSIISTTYSHFNLCGDTANVCYKKTAITAAGGFNHYFRFPTTEDWEMKIRMHKNNQTLAYMADKPVLHQKRLSFKTYIKFWLRHGWGCFLMSIIHPETKTLYNFTFLKALKRTLKEVQVIKKITNNTGWLRIIRYSWLILIRNFCLWLGKYLIPLFELNNVNIKQYK